MERKEILKNFLQKVVLLWILCGIPFGIAKCSSGWFPAIMT